MEQQPQPDAPEQPQSEQEEQQQGGDVQPEPEGERFKAEGGITGVQPQEEGDIPSSGLSSPDERREAAAGTAEQTESQEKSDG